MSTSTSILLVRQSLELLSVGEFAVVMLKVFICNVIDIYIAFMWHVWKDYIMLSTIKQSQRGLLTVRFHVRSLGKLFTDTYVSVTKQYNLLMAKGRWCCAAGSVTIGLAVMTAKIVVNKNLAIANRSRISCINTNNNTMTLKSGLEVTQGHWKWYYLKAWVWFLIRLL